MFVLSKSLFLFFEGLLLTGGLLAFLTHRQPRLSIRVGSVSAGIASLAGAICGLTVLLQGTAFSVILPWSLLGTVLTFTVGPLEAFFITVISVICVAVSVYSYGYMREYIGNHNLGILGLLYNLFIFSMLSLVASGSSLMFLFFWELMSLASYLLVVYDHRDAQVRQAGFIYVVMTHIGTMFIMVAFFLLYGKAGDFSFAGFAAVGSQLPAGLKNVLFILLTIGFGTKAGIIPLHIWLPKAHPAAPSNVSAIMSGVMLKTAIFGFVKIVIGVLGQGPAWWGLVIVAIGSVSALLGVMYALMEHDIKRLLAYHSVENIGIILLGIGSALIFTGYGNKTLAMIGLVAAFFHVFNHAIFKSLLFLGAGAVHTATHTKDVEKLGGLWRRMPWTGLFFLIGSVSIAALPPFNGFVSEWLTFQSLLAMGSGAGSVVLRIVGPLAGAMLALTGALAAACFVKAFGIQFLAMPRSAKAEHAKEVSFSMLLGMGLLSVLCLLFGVMPFLVLRLLNPVAKALLAVEVTPVLGGYRWLNIPGPVNHSSVQGLSQAGTVSMLLLVVLLGLAILAVLMVTRWTGKGGTVRIDETWNCGADLTPRMEYTATSFSKPIRLIFKRIFMPKRLVETEYVVKPYFTTNIKYEGHIKPVFEDALYRPVTRLFIALSNKIRFLQSGSIHLYLLYIFVTLVLLLVFVR